MRWIINEKRTALRGRWYITICLCSGAGDEAWQWYDEVVGGGRCPIVVSAAAPLLHACTLEAGL